VRKKKKDGDRKELIKYERNRSKNEGGKGKKSGRGEKL
jgi:hypothetical protein